MREYKSEICSLFQSRRLGGTILSINLSSYKNKACTFNCIYCALGKTIKHSKSLSEEDCYDLCYVKNELKKGMEYFSKHCPEISAINVAGIGEPTIYYRFYEACEYLLEMRKIYFPNHPLSIFTNLSGEYSDDIFSVLEMFDNVYCKLDSADEYTFRKINIPAKGVEYGRILQNLKKLKKYILSVALIEANYNSIKSDAFISILKDIKPPRICIYEVDRPKCLSSGKEVYFRVGKEKILEVKNFLLSNINADVDVIYMDESRGKHDLLNKLAGD